MDPQILFSFDAKASLSRLKWTPREIDLLEIQVSKSAVPEFRCRSIGTSSVMLKTWLDESTVDQSDKAEQAGTLSLILESSKNTTVPCQETKYPTKVEIEMLAHAFNPPICEADFKHVLKTFDLPLATPTVYRNTIPHFHEYSIDSEVHDSAVLGYTLRMPTKGVLWLTVSLSVSYCPSKGYTRALLHGCTHLQRAALREQLRSFSSLAPHPLLIPMLLITMKQKLIDNQEQRLWARLVDTETKSGLTGAPAIGAKFLPTGSLTDQNIDFVTRRALGIVQIATYTRTHAQALLVIIQSIQESVSKVNTATSHPNKERIEKAGRILSERLTFLAQTIQVMLSDLDFIEKRAQVQITAVYNFLAQKDARISQTLAEDSRTMAADSSQIAIASKRDSSAMKGLSVLTMFFLPGTFLATFFSMPFFNSASKDSSTLMTVRLWVYWAVAAPLTMAVLLIYALYLLHVKRRDRAEDCGPAPSLRPRGSSKLSPTSTSHEEPLWTFRIPFTNFCLQARHFSRASLQFWDEERTKAVGETSRQTDFVPEPLQEPTLPSHPDHTLLPPLPFDQGPGSCDLPTLPVDYVLPRKRTMILHALDEEISLYSRHDGETELGISDDFEQYRNPVQGQSTHPAATESVPWERNTKAHTGGGD